MGGQGDKSDSKVGSILSSRQLPRSIPKGHSEVKGGGRQG